MADSHQRSPIARLKFNGRISGRAVKIAAPLALVATLAPVAVGVAATGGVPASADLGAVFAAGPAEAADNTRAPQVSRSVPRVSWTPAEADRLARKAATAKAIREAHVTMWTTEELKLWSGPGEKATLKGTVKAVREVLLTGRESGSRVEIVRDGEARWIDGGELSSTKPVVLANGDVTAPCAATGGSTLGLQPAAVQVLNAVCAEFPQISTYGGRDPHGEHVNGGAIDIMTSDYALGTAIANYLIANASQFGIDDVIWRQQIWMPGFGWKGMSDRGSATANHFDHVHVKVV